MRPSTLLLALPTALAIPIPSTYTWSFTQWSSGWYGIGWANFRVDAPQTTISGVTVPALSLTGICHIANKGGETQNCNDLIAGSPAGRSLEFTLRPFDPSLQEVQLDAEYKFAANGKNYVVEAYLGRDPQTKLDATIKPSTLREA